MVAVHLLGCFIHCA